MNHSTWDLEIHAREMRRRRMREADRLRQIEEAQRGGDGTRIAATRFSISRLMTVFRNCFSPRPIPVDAAGSPALGAARLRPQPAEKSRLIPDARVERLAQPYAGMVVLARGTSVQAAVQPCAAGDC